MRTFTALSFSAVPVLGTLALCAAGCTARPIDFDETTAGSADGGTEGTSATTGPSTTGPSTTGPSTTGPSTTGPSTTGPDPGTTGPDPGTTGPDPDGGWMLDVQPPDPWPDIPPDVCASSWGPGTWIQGVDPWGDFYGNRAWLGMQDPWQPGRLKIVILGKNADVAANLAEGQKTTNPLTGPALSIQTDFPWPDWYQAGPVPAMMIRDGQMLPVMVEIEIFEQLGNWDTWEPGAPPRVRGKLEWAGGEPFGFDGQFDAAYCGWFNEIAIGE